MRYTWWGLVFLLLPMLSFAATCPTLSRGMSGSTVSAVQRFLFSAYQDFPSPTGFFGPTTELAVKQWQGEHGIEKTGAVGPKTAAAMKINLCATTTSKPITTTSNPTASTKAALIQALLAQVKVLQDKIAALLAAGGGSVNTTGTVAITDGGGGGSTTGIGSGGGTEGTGGNTGGGSSGGGGSGGGTQSTTYAWQTGGWSACTNATQSRTASCVSSQNATVADSYCAATKPATSQSCSVAAGTQSCTFNTAQTVAHGASVTAYQNASVPGGQTCVSQSRTCTNGTLSGSYTNAACTVSAAASCTFNGQTVASGSSVTAYQSSSAAYGSQCVSQTRTCGNGTLSGSYTTSSCSVSSPPGATLEDFWNGTANFQQILRQPGNSATRGTIAANGAWYNFALQPVPNTDQSAQCGATEIVVMKSTNQGVSWSSPQVIATPTAGTAYSCTTVDGGTPYYDISANTWQYLFQCTVAGGTWNVCHASRNSADPMGPWTVDSTASVTSGDIFKEMGVTGWGEEGTPAIAEKIGNKFYVTFHGFNNPYGNRIIAWTTDWHSWSVDTNTPIFSKTDCAGWNVPWDGGGCVGSGSASVVNNGSYYYMVIDAVDKNLAAVKNQHAAVGIVRTTNLTYPTWENLPGGSAIAFSTAQPDTSGDTTVYGVGYPQLFQDGSNVYLNLYRLIPYYWGDDVSVWQNEVGVNWYKLVKGGPTASYSFDIGTAHRQYYPSETISRGDLEARVDNVTWLGPGLGMNGNNSVVKLPDNPVLKRSAPWTLEVKLTVTGEPTQEAAMIAGDAGSGFLSLYKSDVINGQMCAFAMTPDGTKSACAPFTRNVQHTVAMVMRFNSVSLVIDGATVATTPFSSPAPAVNRLQVGTAQSPDPANYNQAGWQGTLHRVAFYDYAIQ